MALDQGKLANIDRRVFAELDRVVGTQAVKIPMSDAAWSTWRRYCGAIGLSMGEGVAGPIVHELEMVVGGRGGGPVFGEQADREARMREERLEVRERRIAARAESLRSKERQLNSREQRIRADGQWRGSQQLVSKVGRNERCPCGSDLKFKHCHGL